MKHSKGTISHQFPLKPPASWVRGEKKTVDQTTMENLAHL